jgi:hypothetical protein
MTITTRRVIAGIFILAFFLTAPILILYTAGFTYNWKKQELSRTGSLVLKTAPRGATVKINGKEIPYKTPFRLNELPPNQYKIEVEKTGAYPWMKTLPVKSQETTFAENIILFKKSAPQNILAGAASRLQLSPNGREAIFLNTSRPLNEIDLVNLADGTMKKIFQFDPGDYRLTAASFSLEGTFVLAELTETRGAVAYKIIDKDFPERVIDLRAATELRSGMNFKFSRTENNVFFFTLDKQIFTGKILANKITTASIYTNPRPAFDFLVKDNSLYLVENNNQKFYLTKKDLDAAPSALPTRVELNRGSLIEKIIGDKILLREIVAGNLFVFNSDLSAILLQKNEVTNYRFNAAENKLLLTSATEINLVDLNQALPNLETVTRVSRGLAIAEWYADANYIFSLKDGRIEILELDNRDTRNVITLAPEKITSFVLDPKGKKMFYTTDEGLFSLELLD